MKGVVTRALTAALLTVSLLLPLSPQAQPTLRPAIPDPLPAPSAAPAPPLATTAPAPGRLVPGARLPAGAPIPQAELEAFVDGAVREAMAGEHVAGMAVSVVQNGQVLLSKGYGFSDLEPAARRVDPNRTLFRLGSVSKTFTWIALMQQVEAGRVRLDAPVNTYLPAALDVPKDGFDRPIRVRDLMTHTPGFADSALGHLFERDVAEVRPLATYLQEERPRRVREPGQFPTYSNYGVGLAGALTSQVAGAPFPDLVERRITGPLRMTQTTFREPHPARSGLPAPMDPALATQLSQGFRWSGQGFDERPLEYIQQIGPAGSASSTASDMARYMLAILGGGTLEGASIYGPRTATAFRTVLQRSAPGVAGWAHGFIEYPLPGGWRGYGHNGATLSFHTSMVTVPELGLGVFVAANTDTGAPFVNRAPALIVQRFYAPLQPAPLRGSPALRVNAAAYEGSYFTTRRAYSGLERFTSMFSGVISVTVSEDGRLLVGVGDTVQAWVPDGPAGRFRSADGEARLVFEMQDGRAVRLLAPTAAYERLSWLEDPGLLGVFAVLTLLACVLILLGSILRLARGSRQSPAQRRSSWAETVTAVLWLTAFGAFALWAAGAADEASVVYGWPGPVLRTAAWSGFTAAVLSLGLLLLLFPALRGDWRGGWSVWRALRHTATVLILCIFAGLLLSWGALTPWSV
ncbi:MAG TPA: serine hydrolase domain-containing protein [Caulobacteraceae bacterium]|jgi:CubicO group peptidase (beta-lactamase class C family)